MDRQHSEIRHLAGKIVAEVCLPHPDNTIDDTAKRLAHMLLSWGDISVAVAGLATAGSMITHLTGRAPDVDRIAARLEPTVHDGSEASRLGHDIGIGFCRSAFSTDTFDRSIRFFFDMLGDATLTNEELKDALATAVVTINIVYVVTPMDHDPGA